MKAKLVDLAVGLDGRQRVTLSIEGDFREQYDALRDSELSIEIKRFRKRRSLDSNGYAWLLIDKLAAALNMTKTDVYRELIRNIGGVSDTVCVPTKAVERLRKGWEHNGLGWFSDEFPSKLEGCTNVILYYGSSSYDSQQMSRLIDLLVEDCKLQGIETATPDELEKYKCEWKP